jgi:transcription termination factor Rho
MAVLRKTELEASPLADLHAISSELGVEGFRAMRREDLIRAILQTQGGEDDEAPPDEVPSGETLEEPAAAADEPPEPAGEEEPEVEEEISDEEIAGGVLDILANGSGFLRVGAGEQSRDDIYVSPAQIRRCELRSGDEVSGPVRPPRRNERHPSLVRVETVNGGQAEPPEQRPWFGDLTPVFASERLAGPPSLEGIPFGKGSRVAVSGPAGAGATTLLREVAGALSANYPDMSLTVVLAGVRPEEVRDWSDSGMPVAGGSFERSPEAHAQAAELAVERAKRVVERGGDAAVIIDALDGLPPAVRRRLFGAARASEEGGTLTVLAATGDDSEVLRWASTRIVLEPGGRIAGDASGTLRADRLS